MRSIPFSDAQTQLLSCDKRLRELLTFSHSLLMNFIIALLEELSEETRLGEE